MSKMKTLSAVIILSTAIATPVLAQNAGMLELGGHSGSKPQPVTNHRSNFRAGYLRTQDDSNRGTLGFGGSDPSRVGGKDPTLLPAG
jgi:hypothetical protein